MAVLLIKKSKFKQGLPGGFGWNQASQRINVDQSYNLVTDDKEFAGQTRSFEVNNVDEIEAIKNQILSKPLISVAKCSKQYKEYRGGRDSEGNRQVEYHTMTDDFVVVLNTSHPEVRRVLDETFEKAKQLMQRMPNLWWCSTSMIRPKPGTAKCRMRTVTAKRPNRLVRAST
ncbi:Hypothetical predicted protein [Paramuricea clavata]|uniref:Uncharacterized protein n=1 Tax=Paramuricea clavata TaxID=317549 RepID=A0A6S7L1W2_PARCT|nr:Hypothetical predicted protein [Paramuricea clavata]